MLTVNQIGHSFGSSATNQSPGAICACGKHAKAVTPSTPRADTEAREPEMDELMADNNFGRMVQELKRVLGPDRGLSSEDIDIEKVKEVMEQYESNEAEWGRYALHDASRNYTRNGVVDINGNANLLILVWSPLKSSAIHDHANAHCCMKVLKGSLKESLYDIPADEEHELSPRQETILRREEVGYISDDIGLHKISNPQAGQYAVSLHLYTPPYASMYGCSMYEANSGRKHHVDMSKYYSWQGKLVNSKSSSTC